MRRIAVVLALIGLIFLLADGAVASTATPLVTYTADALPSEEGWNPYPGSNTSEGAVASIENGLLHLNCPRFPGLYWMKDLELDPEKIVEFEIDFKLVSGNAFHFSIHGETYRTTLWFYPDGVYKYYMGEKLFNIDTTSGFHKYKLVLAQETARLYIDGILGAEWQSNTAMNWVQYLGYQFVGVSFGDGTSYESADVYIDEIKVTQGVASTLEDGLVAYYPLDGNADDAGANALHGTESGSVAYVDGVMGQAAAFDGTNGRITVLDDPLLNFGSNDFTISCWIKSLERINGMPIINKYWDITQGWGIGLQLNRTVGVTTRTSNTESACLISDMALNTTDWYHILLLRSGDKIHLYMNGTLEASTSIPNPDGSFSTTKNMLIGSITNKTPTTYTYNGSIDEIRIYNRALAEAEIQELYDEKDVTPTCDLTDSDGDGVIDQWDTCPDTPVGSYVDPSGCPLTGYYTQEELDAAVDSAEAVKDAIIAEKMLEISNLNALIGEKNLIISDLNATIDSLEQSVSDLQAQIAAKDQTISDLQDTISLKDQLIAQLQATIEERDQTISGLNVTIADLNAIIDSMFTQEQVDLMIQEACPGNSEYHGKSKNHLHQQKNKHQAKKNQSKNHKK